MEQTIKLQREQDELDRMQRRNQISEEQEAERLAEAARKLEAQRMGMQMFQDTGPNGEMTQPTSAFNIVYTEE